jgi:hypothetical protein
MKKLKGNGAAFLIFMWVVIAIFETYWLITGVRDPWAIIAMPAFFGVLSFVIMKWSLRWF